MAERARIGHDARVEGFADSFGDEVLVAQVANNFKNKLGRSSGRGHRKRDVGKIFGLLVVVDEHFGAAGLADVLAQLVDAAQAAKVEAANNFGAGNEVAYLSVVLAFIVHHHFIVALHPVEERGVVRRGDYRDVVALLLEITGPG